MLTNNNSEISPNTVETPNNLLNVHLKVAENTRNIAKFLIQSIANNIDNENNFFRLIQKSDRAALTLQRLSSILGNLLPLEHQLNQRRSEANTATTNDTVPISHQDYEIIINQAKEWGILRPGCENDIESVVKLYNNHEVIQHVQ